MSVDLNAKTYVCAICHELCTTEDTPEWNNEKATEEMKKLWGEGTTHEDCDIVCDDCFQKIHPSKFPDRAQSARKD